MKQKRNSSEIFVLGVKNSTNFANFFLGEIHQIFINKKLNTK